MPEKKLTLNTEKRKAIADVFQNHFEQNSPKYELHKKTYTVLGKETQKRLTY